MRLTFRRAPAFRHAAAALALLLTATGACAQAPSYPTKPVHIYSPFSTGTGPDVIMRLIGESLRRKWNQPVILEARPGASGFIAMQAVKQAAPDGYGLAVIGDAILTINPFLHEKMPYEAADFVSIMRLYTTPFFVMVSTAGRYKTLGDLLVAARSASNKLSYGSTNVASPGHLGAAMLAFLSDTQMVHVPFRDAQQIFVSLANGDLDFAFASVATANAHIEAGRVKPIAIGMKSRWQAYPDIPTIKEAGGPDMEYLPWAAMVAPRGTPPELIDKLNTDIREALADPLVAERIRKLGTQIAPTGPKELDEIIRAGAISNAQLVKRVGLGPK